MKPPASRTWARESNVVGDEEVAHMQRWRDPETGVHVLRLTSLPYLNTHLYPEAPASMPDGRRFIFRRTHPFGPERHYWIADLVTRQIRQITDEPDVAGFPVVAPDGQAIYYTAGGTVWRMSPETFEREPVYEIPTDQFARIGAGTSISHCGTRLLAGASLGPGRHGVACIDLKHQTTRMAFEHPDCLNPHTQYCRTASYKILVQVNDGIEFDQDGNRLKLIGEHGASIWVGNDDGSDFVKLNVGSQPLERVQGHQCWVGGQERVITTLHRRQSVDRPWIQDKIVTLAPGDPCYRVVGFGEPGFTHMHTSGDGKWWVSDCNHSSRIYVGSTETGRFKLFASSGATFGEAQFTHPHPCFIGNDHAIGWNSDVTGIPHVYVARIPAGFLDELQ